MIELMASAMARLVYTRTKAMDRVRKDRIPLVFGARENLLASWIFTGVDALPFLCFADAMGGGSVGDWKRNLRGGSGSRHGVEKRSEDQQSETEGSLEVGLFVGRRLVKQKESK